MKIDMPSPKELRKFGLLFSIFLIIFTKFILGFIFEIRTEWWPYVVSAIIAVTALTNSKILIVLYYPWMIFANILHSINTHIIIGFIYYIIITPTGIIMRLAGKNPMKSIQDTNSYRIKSYSRKKHHIEKPY